MQKESQFAKLHILRQEISIPERKFQSILSS